MSEEVKGNPNVPDQQQADEAIFGSQEGFFDQMDRQVNGAIIDDQPEQVTPEVKSGSPEVTHAEEQTGSVEQEVDWQKRYKDSSREAIKMKDSLNTLKPFVPLLNAMKNDSGLVTHIRDYLQGGGKPAKSIKEQLNLDEDFVFDQNEAMTDPDSDSAKVFNAHVNGAVQSRVGNILQGEKKKAQQVRQAIDRKREEEDFKKRHNMGDEEFSGLMAQAKSHKMTMDDVYYILNKDKVAGNVARSTKQDMLDQMKSVRDIPTTASGVNSPRTEKNPNDDVFDTILGQGQDLDDLFG